MSEQPFMQLWIADFLGDTLHLSAEEVGQYMLLLMASWRAGGYLTADRGALSRVCRGPVSDAVLAFFDESEGRISQKRLLAELVRAKQLRNIRSEAGKRGAKAKALKNNNATLANASAKDKQGSSIPEPEPDKLDTNVSKRAKSLPSGWTPSPENQTNNLSRYSDAEIREELEKFRDHFTANGKRMKDWDAAFRNWMRRRPEFQRGNDPPRKDFHASVDDQFDKIRRFTNGYGNTGTLREGNTPDVAVLPAPDERDDDRIHRFPDDRARRKAG
ncbi:DUF1376 domain-containing protein [Nitrospirales bacterium NOB]|nr:DUF1376 domain-containing protein [Nitrospirales bacterium NOB]